MARLHSELKVDDFIPGWKIARNVIEVKIEILRVFFGGIEVGWGEEMKG